MVFLLRNRRLDRNKNKSVLRICLPICWSRIFYGYQLFLLIFSLWKGQATPFAIWVHTAISSRCHGNRPRSRPTDNTVNENSWQNGWHLCLGSNNTENGSLMLGPFLFFSLFTFQMVYCKEFGYYNEHICRTWSICKSNTARKRHQTHWSRLDFLDAWGMSVFSTHI